MVDMREVPSPIPRKITFTRGMAAAGVGFIRDGGNFALCSCGDEKREHPNDGPCYKCGICEEFDKIEVLDRGNA